MREKMSRWLAEEPNCPFTLFGKKSAYTHPLNRAARISERFTTLAGFVATGVAVATAASSICAPPLISLPILISTAAGGATVSKIVGYLVGTSFHESVKMDNPPSPSQHI